MKRLKIVLLAVVAVFIYSCSSSDSVKEKEVGAEKLDEMELQEVRLDIKIISAWINLMPNTDSKFHVSGEVSVKENFKYDLNFMSIAKINISQNDEQIYSIIPTVQVDGNLSTENSKYFRFSTIRGLSRDPRLIINDPVEFDLVFDDGNDEYTYYINNVEIKKVY